MAEKVTKVKQSSAATEPTDKLALDKVLYLDEVLKTIRSINQLILRIDNEPELLNAACHELGGKRYKMVWIGYTKNGSLEVEPVAHSNGEDGYLSSVRVTWDESEDGQGPTGTAIRTAEPVIIANIQAGLNAGPAREEALRRGYRSCAAIPLTIDKIVIGAVTLYSGTTGAFDDAELDVLKEVAGDISLGIQKIRQRQKLRQAEERYRSTLDDMLEGVQLISRDWRYLYLNEAAAKHGRRTRDELLGRTMAEAYPGIEQTKMFGRLRQCMETRVPQRLETEFTFPDGSKAWFELSIEPAPEGVLILSVDISERKQAEQALRFSEEKFSKAFHSSPAAMRLIDVETVRVVDINDNFLKLTGYSRDEAIGHTSWELKLFKEDPSAYAERRRILKETGKFSDLQMTVVTKSGEERQCLMSSEVLNLNDRLYSLSTLRDITNQKQAEEALSHSEEKLRLLFESVSLGIAVTDLNGVITEANPRLVETLGFKSRSELIGRNIYEFNMQRSHVGALQMRQTLEKGIKGTEYSLLKADGTRFPGEFTASVLKDASGGLVGFITIIRDITERKQADVRIRQAAEEWRRTFDSITDPISIHDRDFRITRVNMAFAQIFNLRPSEIIGKCCYELVHGTSQPIPDCPHRVTLETGKPARAEAYEPKIEKHLDISTSPIIDDKGAVISSVHVMRDITERKNMEQQLVLTDRLASLGELASGIAHEVNNPLTGVIGISQLLLARDLASDVREDLQLVHNEAQRAAQVVKNLLTFARKHPVARQHTDVNEVIAKVLGVRAYEQKVNNIHVITHLAPDLPPVMADPFQLQQVFFNLVINAEYFMTEAHKKGTLTVTTVTNGGSIGISFADDGPGIPAESLKRLFSPFFTTKPVGKGTGLGLSICHGVITAHGGRIRAESEPGKGTTFYVEIPTTIGNRAKNQLQ